MRIEHLQEFVELSRQLNFTAAAKTLHMTQPALSNHVRILEKETGVMLIERGSVDHARLTPAGQRFLDMATRIVSIYDETMPEIKELQQNIEGKITIRSPRHEYSAPLLSYVFEFRNDHPHIDIAIRPWNDTDGIEDVASGTVDLAYVGYGVRENEPLALSRGLSLVPYTTTETLLWVDTSHPLAAQPTVDVHDLDGRSILIPANQKHDSWLLCVSGFIERHGLTCEIVEKYCDSLEDFALTKATTDDLMICDENLFGFPPFKLREDRVQRRFNPPVYAPVTLAYRTDSDNQALMLLVDFLRTKYEEHPSIPAR